MQFSKIFIIKLILIITIVVLTIAIIHKRCFQVKEGFGWKNFKKAVSNAANKAKTAIKKQTNKIYGIFNLNKKSSKNISNTPLKIIEYKVTKTIELPKILDIPESSEAPENPVISEGTIIKLLYNINKSRKFYLKNPIEIDNRGIQKSYKINSIYDVESEFESTGSLQLCIYPYYKDNLYLKTDTKTLKIFYTTDSMYYYYLCDINVDKPPIPVQISRSTSNKSTVTTSGTVAIQSPSPTPYVVLPRISEPKPTSFDSSRSEIINNDPIFNSMSYTPFMPDPSEIPPEPIQTTPSRTTPKIISVNNIPPYDFSSELGNDEGTDDNNDDDDE